MIAMLLIQPRSSASVANKNANILTNIFRYSPDTHFQYQSLKSLGLDAVKKYDCNLLRKKRVCSTFDEYKKHSNDLIKRFVKKLYKASIIRNQIEKVDNLERSTLLSKTNAVRKTLIAFSVTYTSTLPNVREIINKH